MNRTLILMLAFVLLFASKAKCDKFIVNGDTININSKNLLDKYPGFSSLKSKLPPCYRVEWALVNNELVLTNIYTCATASTHLKALDLKSIFGTNGSKILGKWVVDTLWTPVGKPLFDYGSAHIYKAEIRIVIKNGIVNSRTEFDYHLRPGKIYSSDREAIDKFIYSNINWKILPNIESHRVKLTFTADIGPTGKLQTFKQLYVSSMHMYNEEANRVLKTLQLETFYKHGKVVDSKTFIQIDFSEENRKKYAR